MDPVTLGIAVGWLSGRFIYHRWIEDWLFPPKVIRVAEEFQIPKAREGDVISLIYGQVRVNAPVLSWMEAPEYNEVTDAYIMNMLFTLGIPFSDGVNAVTNMWAGDKKFFWNIAAPPGLFFAQGESADGTNLGAGLVEPLDGNPLQKLVEDDGTHVKNIGASMINAGLGATTIPGYRGYTSIGLIGWQTSGRSNNLSAYGFETSSYQLNHPRLGTFAKSGVDSNPVNVIHDLLTGTMGKLGLPESLIDMPSFEAAQWKLFSEGHGYSRAISELSSGEKVIQEILRQIDAVLYEDPKTGKIGIKLIRNDYDPLTIPHINSTNCEDITNYAAGGWENLPNKIRILFTNREDDYQDGTGNAQNLGAVDFTDFTVREQLIEMRGVTRQELAYEIAERELAARSRPIAKGTAIVDRSFMDVKQGDAVRVTWDNHHIDGLVFRVAAVDRGSRADGKIQLDLIQDYFYVWRNQFPKPTGLGGLATPPLTAFGG